jgi:hypothetical protein
VCMRPCTMMRPSVKVTSSRTCRRRSHPACCTAGVMYWVQMSRSDRVFLFMLRRLCGGWTLWGNYTEFLGDGVGGDWKSDSSMGTANMRRCMTGGASNY